MFHFVPWCVKFDKEKYPSLAFSHSFIRPYLVNRANFDSPMYVVAKKMAEKPEPKMIHMIQSTFLLSNWTLKLGNKKWKTGVDREKKYWLSRFQCFGWNNGAPLGWSLFLKSHLNFQISRCEFTTETKCFPQKSFVTSCMK